MGFDINVMMELFLCPVTGKPYYYGRDKETKRIEKVYELPTLIVPETLRKYLVGRGHIFHAYTDHFNEKEIFNVSVDEFLEDYPSWDEIQQSSDYCDECGWIEEDHEGFKQVLEWCCQQGVSFRVAWSY